MKISEIISKLEQTAPLAYQEDYDNAGLIIGNPNKDVDSALVCLDVTHETLDEAISNGHGLIIAHHPMIFRGLKKLTGKNLVEQLTIKAIKNDIAVYAMHTNLDNISKGVNQAIADKLNLQNTRVLKPARSLLRKIVVFCPDIKLSDGKYVPGLIRNAVFDAGAGFIGDYDNCSYNTEGYGTYRGLEGTNPYIGTQGKMNVQKEIKIESIFPAHLEKQVIQAMLEAHPYEEVAYDIYPLENAHEQVGAGMVGELGFEMEEKEFLGFVKDQMNATCIRHTHLLKKKVSKIALCGGAGSFLLKDAMTAGADVFISSDFKYHDFFEANNRILIADIGHYESEQFTIDLIHDILRKNFSIFAISKSKVITNPINYL